MAGSLTVFKCADSAENISHYDEIVDGDQMWWSNVLIQQKTLHNMADGQQVEHAAKNEREIRHGEHLKYIVRIIIINIT